MRRYDAGSLQLCLFGVFATFFLVPFIPLRGYHA